MYLFNELNVVILIMLGLIRIDVKRKYAQAPLRTIFAVQTISRKYILAIFIFIFLSRYLDLYSLDLFKIEIYT